MPEVTKQIVGALRDHLTTLLGALVDPAEEPPIPSQEPFDDPVAVRRAAAALKVIKFAAEYDPCGWKKGLIGVYLVERFEHVGLEQNTYAQAAGCNPANVSHALWVRLNGVEGTPATRMEILAEARQHFEDLANRLWVLCDEMEAALWRL